MSSLPTGFTPRLLIFDLDGTLVNSERGIVASFNHALVVAAGARALPRARIAPLIGLPLARMFAEVLPSSLHDRISLCVEAYRAHYETTAIPASRLFPGTRATLRALRRTDRVLVVATSKLTHVAEATLNATQLRPLFAHVLGVDAVAEHKPHPALVLRALELTGTAPEEAVVVGDTTYDIQMAKSAGVCAIAVTHGVHAGIDLRAAGADVLIDSLPQLLPLVGLLPRARAVRQEVAHAPLRAIGEAHPSAAAPPLFEPRGLDAASQTPG